MQITIPSTETINLILPAFFKDEIGEATIYIGILNEKTFAKALDFPRLTQCSIDGPGEAIVRREIATAIADYTPITEAEFFAAWKRLYSDMDLMPKEVEHG